MPYSPPTGDNVIIDFSLYSGSNYSPPDGDNVFIDFSTVEQTFPKTARLACQDVDSLVAGAFLTYVPVGGPATDSDILESGAGLYLFDTDISPLGSSDTLTVGGILEFVLKGTVITDSDTVSLGGKEDVLEGEIVLGDTDTHETWGSWQYWNGHISLSDSDESTIDGKEYMVEPGITFQDSAQLDQWGFEEYTNLDVEIIDSDNLVESNVFFQQAILLIEKDEVTIGADTVSTTGGLILSDNSAFQENTGDYYYVFNRRLGSTDSDTISVSGRPEIEDGRITPEERNIVSVSGSLYAQSGEVDEGDKDTVSLGGVEDHPPVFTTTPLKTVYLWDMYSYRPEATDDFSEPIISLGTAPEFLTFEDGELIGFPGLEDAGFYTVSLYATDDMGGFTTQSYTLQVVAPYSPKDDFISFSHLLEDLTIVTLEFSGVGATGDVQYYYISNYPYVSYPTDSPMNQAFIPVIKEVSTFNRSVDIEINGSDTSWGDITFFNNSSFDNLIAKQYTQFREFSLKKGKARQPLSEFVEIIKGVIGEGGVTSSDIDEIAIPVRANSVLLDVPLTEDKFSEDHLLHPEEGMPECWGGTFESPVFNVSPVLVDQSELRYKYHNGRAGGVVTVRDEGVEVSFEDHPETGEFVLLHPPEGEITADVVGGYSGNGGRYSDPGSLVYNLLADKTDVPIEVSSFEPIILAYSDLVVGFYTKDATDVEVKEVVEWILSSINSFFDFRRSGFLYIMRYFNRHILLYRDEYPVPDYTLTEDDIGPDIEVEDTLPAVVDVIYKYRKNWMPQTSFADYIHTERLDLKTLYEKPYTEITRTNAGVKDIVTKPEPKIEFESLIINEIWALRMANERAEYRSMNRIVFGFDVFYKSTAMNLGDVIKVDTDRAGIDELSMIVVGVEDSVTDAVGRVRALR